MDQFSAGKSAVAAGLKILVVDDNVDAANMFAMLIQFEGHDVRTAFNGAQAIESVQAFTPDAVFLDISLPDMTGYRVAEQLRRIPALDKAMLVAMTGYSDEDHQARSEKAGFDHHVVKPADHAYVMQLLDQAACRR
ncbi:response regulator [Paludisphaera mucosa]|uniref:Response regulator n=1 Tax=Paludisphaera mucosa TaxID=3030827 RepID=A0ABT6FDS6_9BACT|nr:response regulator [Paludisphaera mucosa]